MSSLLDANPLPEHRVFFGLQKGDGRLRRMIAVLVGLVIFSAISVSARSIKGKLFSSAPIWAIRPGSVVSIPSKKSFRGRRVLEWSNLSAGHKSSDHPVPKSNRRRLARVDAAGRRVQTQCMLTQRWINLAGVQFDRVGVIGT